MEKSIHAVAVKISVMSFIKGLNMGANLEHTRSEIIQYFNEEFPSNFDAEFNKLGLEYIDILYPSTK